MKSFVLILSLVATGCGGAPVGLEVRSGGETIGTILGVVDGIYNEIVAVLADGYMFDLDLFTGHVTGGVGVTRECDGAQVAQLGPIDGDCHPLPFPLLRISGSKGVLLGARAISTCNGVDYCYHSMESSDLPLTYDTPITLVAQ